MKTVYDELTEVLVKHGHVWDPTSTGDLIKVLANRIETLEIRVNALETWKRPRHGPIPQNPSPTNEAGVPSEQVPATSVPPEKELNP